MQQYPCPPLYLYLHLHLHLHYHLQSQPPPSAPSFLPQCGEKLKRTEPYTANVVGSSRQGGLQLDITKIRQRQADVGSVYVPPGPHHFKTEHKGVGECAGGRQHEGLGGRAGGVQVMAGRKTCDFPAQVNDTSPPKLQILKPQTLKPQP